MENLRKGTSVHMTFSIFVRIVGIVVTAISTIVRIVDISQKAKERHQKSNRPQPKE